MEQTLSLEYNSQRTNLEIPEYGRHIQKLIKHAKTIESEEIRQATVENIVDLMLQMNPQHKNVDEYVDRLWRHVFRIADYDLEVTPPKGIDSSRIKKEEIELKLEYPQNVFNHRHYGHNVQVLIEKAIAMEDPEKKKEFTRTIAAYMKLAYKTWNREHHVNDDTIKNDIRILSKGKLELSDDYKIYTLKNTAKKRTSNSNNNNNRRRKNRGKSNNYRNKK